MLMIAKSLFDLKVEKWQSQQARQCLVQKISPLERLGKKMCWFILDVIEYGNKANKDYKQLTYVVKQVGNVNRVYINEQTNIFISVTNKEAKMLNDYLKVHFKTSLKAHSALR